MTKRIVGVGMVVAGISAIALTSTADVTGVPCQKTRTECNSAVKTIFTNLGCNVTSVSCTGLPPPPGGTRGDYKCVVSSPNCSTVPSNLLHCTGTLVDALGYRACKDEPIKKCNRRNAADARLNKCEWSRPLIEADCHRGTEAREDELRLADPVPNPTHHPASGNDYCHIPGENYKPGPQCETIDGYKPQPNTTRGDRDVCIWPKDGLCAEAGTPDCTN